VSEKAAADLYQALWYFLSGAVLLGLILHYTLRIFTAVFHLDRQPPLKPKPIPAKGHDAISYRKARQAKKQKKVEERELQNAQARLIASQPMIQEAVREAKRMSLLSQPNPVGSSRQGLLQETILEQTDEDDDDSVF
jgi:hypothetical protein